MNPDNLSTGTKTIIIKPGETIVLPKGAVVQSLIYDGAVDVTSSCGVLPEPQDYKCYVLVFSSNDNKSASPNLEGEDTVLDYLEIAGVKYLGPVSMDHAGNDFMDILKDRLTVWFSSTPPQSLFKYDHIDISGTGERVTVYLYFKSIDSIVNTIKLKMSGPGFDNGLFILPATSEGSCS